tara:strand:- start:3053 stop:3301 length:249 start_codon:yes stop_codon:yes gene_type:complete
MVVENNVMGGVAHASGIYYRLRIILSMIFAILFVVVGVILLIIFIVSEITGGIIIALVIIVIGIVAFFVNNWFRKKVKNRWG